MSYACNSGKVSTKIGVQRRLCPTNPDSSRKCILCNRPYEGFRLHSFCITVKGTRENTTRQLVYFLLEMRDMTVRNIESIFYPSHCSGTNRYISSHLFLSDVSHQFLTFFIFCSESGTECLQVLNAFGWLVQCVEMTKMMTHWRWVHWWEPWYLNILSAAWCMKCSILDIKRRSRNQITSLYSDRKTSGTACLHLNPTIVKQLGDDFHEWRSHEWESLPYRPTSILILHFIMITVSQMFVPDCSDGTMTFRGRIMSCRLLGTKP